MADKESLAQLFKTLQKALDSHSVQDITEAVSAYLAKKSDKHEEIHFVLEIICEEFNISRRMLVSSNLRGKITEARNLTYCLLHNELRLPVRYISTGVIPRKTHCGVFNAVSYFKSLNTEVKVDREFKEKYDRMLIKLSEFIRSKNNTHEKS